ncbi:penicillin-binding protein [Patescibacteria group bacterium]|nr:penicillin-binding protein [Patescibacteria group bacterium]
MLDMNRIRKRQTRAYLKRQRLLARRHRAYMRLRNLRSSRVSDVELHEKRPGFIGIVAILLASLGFHLKEGWFRVRTWVEVITLRGWYLIKKTTHHLTGSGAPIPLPPTMEQRTKRTTKKKPIGSYRLRSLAFGVGIVGLVILGIFFVWVATLAIPDVDNFENRKISNSTKIYDRSGEIVLYDIHENIRRTVVDFDNIAESAKDAIVAIEDHSFYEHHGVVWKSTFRGAFQTLLSKLHLSSAGTAGGSTLTQQVVKNTLLTRDRAISRKVKEWVLAYKIENRLTKDEILEIYLNEAPYGGTIYGIEEASERFFGIPASDLSVAQSAYLAAIPNLPTYYSPYGPNKDKLDQRQRTVLDQMLRYGFISDDQYRVAIAEDVTFLPEEDGYAKSLHFVEYVRAQLEETYGVDMVENGGLQVVTTLDYELQQRAEEIIADHIAEVEELYNASNAALVAIDSQTGQIITMVGSRDYFDTEGFDGNFNVALAPRQPGSSFKPIAYATAFERGYLPESTIFDVETQFNARCDAYDTTSDNGCYSPNNYDFDFKGPLTFRNALAQSRNIPAIKVLYMAGLSRVIEKARAMGITSLDQSPEYYGLGLVLGGGEVSLLQMVGAYSVLSNDGVYQQPTGILKVTDLDGNVLEEYEEQPGERVVEENAARMVNSILSDNVARTPLFGSQSFLYFGGRDVAGKTGTTNDNRDAWLIGYTPDVAVGVWTGNNDNSPMKKGSSISGKPWRAYMDEVLKNYDQSSFRSYELPENWQSYPNMVKGDWYGGTTVYLDTVSGKLATEFTPEETKIAVPQPDPHTILHWINKDNPRVLDTSRDDPQYENWEYAVKAYVNENLSVLFDFDINLPTDYDDVHTGEGAGAFTAQIDGIEEGVFYSLGEELTATVSSPERSDRKIDNVQFFVNNAFAHSDGSGPFTFRFKPEELPYVEENNILKVIMTDEDGIKASAEMTFSLNI